MQKKVKKEVACLSYLVSTHLKHLSFRKKYLTDNVSCTSTNHRAKRYVYYSLMVWHSRHPEVKHSPEPHWFHELCRIELCYS